MKARTAAAALRIGGLQPFTTIDYPGALAAVVFVQGFLIEGLRFLGDWRNLLFGALIVLAMNVRPRGLLDAQSLARLGRLVGRGR